MKKILAALALVLGMSFIPASPAAADTPPDPYGCYHGNVGPYNGSFWTFIDSYSDFGRHTHSYSHYYRRSDGKYYYDHTSSRYC